MTSYFVVGGQSEPARRTQLTNSLTNLLLTKHEDCCYCHVVPWSQRIPAMELAGLEPATSWVRSALILVSGRGCGIVG